MNHSRHAFWKFLALIPLVLVFTAETCQTTTIPNSPNPPVVVTDRFNATNVSPSRQGSVTATCNSGESMLSGGYGVTTRDYASPIQRLPGDLYYVYADYPSSQSSWTISLYNRTRDDTAFLVAHVECATNLKASPTIATAMYAYPGYSAPARAKCGTDGLTGGGYQITGIANWYEVMEVTQAYGFDGPNSTTEWTVLARPDSSATYTQNMQVYSYAVCSTLTTTLGPSANVTAPQGNNQSHVPTSGRGSAGCGPGELLTGAEWSDESVGSAPISSFFPSYGSSQASWGVTVWSVPVQGYEGWYEDSQTVKVTALCATV